MKSDNLIALDTSELNEVAVGAGASLGDIFKLNGISLKDINISLPSIILDSTPKKLL